MCEADEDDQEAAVGFTGSFQVHFGQLCWLPGAGVWRTVGSPIALFSSALVFL